MRLHRISLLNLNSLYGEQALDFDRDLQGANLFLIHGRTGSGKSTVMDAVSLALFGKTPRLDAQRSALGSEPSGIMSRGTGECRAEVEFSRLFADGTRGRYRAAWSLRRARKRADGTLQQVERSLERLGTSGQWELLASGKKVTQFDEALSAVLEGFTVDDFHRSMLLAQGRFDELLSARAEHRASILERLTRTEEYLVIGSNAAELAKAHKQNIDFLTRQLGTATPVTGEELEKVSDAATAAHEKTQLCARALDTAKSHLQWWTVRERLRSELDGLEGDRVSLEKRAIQLAPLLDQLSDHKRCDAGFALIDRVDELDAKVAKCSVEIERTAGIQIEALSLRERCISLRDADEQLAKRAEGLLLSLRDPYAQYAAAKDAAATSRTVLDGLQVRVAKAQSSLEERTGKVLAATMQVERALEESRLAKESLAGCARIRGFRDQWKNRWQEFCIALEAHEKNLAQSAQDLATREQGLSAALADFAKRNETHAAHRTTKLIEPQSEAEKCQARLAELVGTEEPKARIRTLRDAVTQRQSEVASLQHAQRELSAKETLESELEQAKAQAEQVERDANASAADAVRAREAANQATLRCSDAERQLHRLELVVEVSRRREMLNTGEECPLCGSTEHPYLDDPGRCPDESTLTATLSEARSERTALEAQAHEAERLARAAENLSNKRIQERDTKREYYESLSAKIAGLTEAVENARQTARLPDDSSSIQCTERLGQLTHQLAELQQEVRALEAAGDAAEIAQQEFVRIQSALAEQTEALKSESIALEQRQRTVLEDRRKHEEESQESRTNRTTLRVALHEADADLLSVTSAGDGELIDWRRRVEAQIALLEKTEHLSERAESKCREVQNQKASEETLLSEVQKHLTDETALENAQVAEYQRLCERVDTLLAEIRLHWVTYTQDDPSEALLPADSDAAAILEHAQKRAESLRETARTSSKAAENAALDEQGLQATLVALRAAHADFEKEQEQARQLFSEVLLQLGFESAEQLKVRRMQPDEVRDAQIKLDELTGAQIAWKTRYDERHQALEKHDGAIPPGLAVPNTTTNETATNPNGCLDSSSELADAPMADAVGPVLATAVTDAELQFKAATEDERAIGVELADTKRRMAEYASAGAALEDAKKKADVWFRLDKLIGTRNGDAFRQFAQGLNLHRLIQKANVHLQRLSERYALTQALDGDIPTLDFAISDLWQGGAPRPTRTLSGGERFQVSLALALGLSDLRTHLLPIETLVLDEGFGTLDPEALETALGVLQRLHANGRQVGVISHVSGLKDRIEAQVRIVEEGAGRSRIEVGRTAQ